jgi:hypothetical protein
LMSAPLLSRHARRERYRPMHALPVIPLHTVRGKFSARPI